MVVLVSFIYWTLHHSNFISMVHSYCKMLGFKGQMCSFTLSAEKAVIEQRTTSCIVPALQPKELPAPELWMIKA